MIQIFKLKFCFSGNKISGFVGYNRCDAIFSVFSSSSSNSSSSNLFISKNTKDTRANYSSEYIVIPSTNFGIL